MKVKLIFIGMKEKKNLRTNKTKHSTNIQFSIKMWHFFLIFQKNFVSTKWKSAWGIIYFCSRYDFFRILKNTLVVDVSNILLIKSLSRLEIISTYYISLGLVLSIKSCVFSFLRKAPQCFRICKKKRELLFCKTFRSMTSKRWFWWFCRSIHFSDYLWYLVQA